MQPAGRVHQYLKENDLELICTKAGPISHFCGKTEVDAQDTIHILATFRPLFSFSRSPRRESYSVY